MLINNFHHLGVNMDNYICVGVEEGKKYFLQGAIPIYIDRKSGKMYFLKEEVGKRCGQ